VVEVSEKSGLEGTFIAYRLKVEVGGWRRLLRCVGGGDYAGTADAQFSSILRGKSQ